MANIKATITPANRLLVTNYAVGGTAGSIQLNNLFDVDATNLANGAMLIYKENQGVGKWTATTELDSEETVLEGGTF